MLQGTAKLEIFEKPNIGCKIFNLPQDGCPSLECHKVKLQETYCLQLGTTQVLLATKLSNSS